MDVRVPMPSLPGPDGSRGETAVNGPRFQRLELPDAERVRILNKLELAEKMSAHKPRRGSARLEYRTRDIPMSVVHPGGGVGRFIVLGRNLSTGGIALLHAGYLHNGTECRMALTLPRGGAKTLVGKVVFCRLVAGQIHEIGVQFSEQINIEDFAASELKKLSDDPCDREAMRELSGNALLVAPDEAVRTLLLSRLKQTGLNPVGVETAGAGVDQVKRLAYVVAVCSLNLPDPGVEKLVRALQSAGFSGPVIGIASETEKAGASRAAHAGMQGCLEMPFAQDQVHAELARALRYCGASGEGSSPIVSTIAHEPRAGELIHFFVSHAREAASAVRAAAARGDLPTVKKHCQSLKSIAGGYGFQSVAEAAKQAVTCMDQSGSVEESAASIRALLNLCGRLSTESQGRLAA